MSDHLFGMIDMGIVGVAVAALAIWQLVSLKREARRDKTDSPESAGHPVGEHRLDDR